MKAVIDLGKERLRRRVSDLGPYDFDGGPVLPDFEDDLREFDCEADMRRFCEHQRCPNIRQPPKRGSSR